MSRLEEYIYSVGIETSNVMKFILHGLLSKRYEQHYDPKFSGKLAAEVANYFFEGTYATAEISDFAVENQAAIETRAQELSSEDSLCQALTCAVYNSCYAQYVQSARKVGFLFHPFLAYVRALQHNEFDVTAHLSKSDKIPPETSLPLLNMSRVGVMRPLPRTPDSKRMLDTVIAFGRSVGYTS